MLDDKEKRRQRLRHKKKDRSRYKKREHKLGDSFQHYSEIVNDDTPPSRPEWDYSDEG